MWTPLCRLWAQSSLDTVVFGVSEARVRAFAASRAYACFAKSRKLFVHKEVSPWCGQIAHSTNGSPTSDDAESVHIPPTGRPQEIHTVVHADSPGCPQAVHRKARSLGRAIRTPPGTPRPWVQIAPHLGTTVGTTGDSCGRIGGRPKPSTDGPICPQVCHHGSPHARGCSDLRKQAQSTQSTTLTTVTAFRSSKRENKTKTGDGRSWGQPRDRVVKSTKRRAARGDVGRRDGLTWTPAPGPCSGRLTRRADRPEGAAGHCPARTWPGRPRRPARAEEGSVVERMRA
jgi:hypothetical protein